MDPLVAAEICQPHLPNEILLDASARERAQPA